MSPAAPVPSPAAAAGGVDGDGGNQDGEDGNDVCAEGDLLLHDNVDLDNANDVNGDPTVDACDRDAVPICETRDDAGVCEAEEDADEGGGSDDVGQEEEDLEEALRGFSVAIRETCRPGARRVYVAERDATYLVDFDDTEESARWLGILHGLGLDGTCVEASSEHDPDENVETSSEDDVDENLDDDSDGSSDDENLDDDSDESSDAENTDGGDAGRPEETEGLTENARRFASLCERNDNACYPLDEDQLIGDNPEERECYRMNAYLASRQVYVDLCADGRM